MKQMEHRVWKEIADAMVKVIQVGVPALLEAFASKRDRRIADCRTLEVRRRRTADRGQNMNGLEIESRSLIRELKARGVSNGPQTASEIAAGQRRRLDIAGMLGRAWAFVLGQRV